MISILYINSSFTAYNMYLCKEPKKPILFISHLFKPYDNKTEQMDNLSTGNTMQVITCAQSNGINSLDIQFRGPMAISPLKMALLKEHGINVRYIKDKTPIPHNGCRKKKKILRQLIK